MTHLTGSAPYHTEELVDMIIIKMRTSIAEITLLKLPVHPLEVTSIQTNESIISQICIASEHAAAPIQNTWRVRVTFCCAKLLRITATFKKRKNGGR